MFIQINIGSLNSAHEIRIKIKVYLIFGTKYKSLVSSREDLLNNMIFKAICKTTKFNNLFSNQVLS